MSDFFIYTLSDPDTNEVRYVGQTINVKQRFKNHIFRRAHGDAYSQHWIKNLCESGKRPVMTVIEKATEDTWEERERFWIKHYKAQGCRLTNLIDGGGSGGKFTPEARQKVSDGKKGKAFSEDHVRNLNAARIGRVFPEETRQKISETKTGRANSDAHRLHISQALKGKPRPKPTPDQLTEIARLLSEGNLTQREIAHLCQIGRHTVRKVAQINHR